MTSGPSGDKLRLGPRNSIKFCGPARHYQIETNGKRQRARQRPPEAPPADAGRALIQTPSKVTSGASMDASGRLSRSDGAGSRAPGWSRALGSHLRRLEAERPPSPLKLSRTSGHINLNASLAASGRLPEVGPSKRKRPAGRHHISKRAPLRGVARVPGARIIQVAARGARCAGPRPRPDNKHSAGLDHRARIRSGPLPPPPPESVVGSGKSEASAINIPPASASRASRAADRSGRRRANRF